jgi:hypothetical protein
MKLIGLTKTICLMALLALALRCSQSAEPPLGGSETTNGDALVVAVVGSGVHGRTAAGFEVALYPRDFSSLTPGMAAYKRFADDSGLFAFEQIPEGVYNLFTFAPHQSGRRGAVVSDLKVGGKGPAADTAQLDSLGGVQGVVRRDGVVVGGVKLFAQGTPFASVTDATGAYVLSGMPQGSYRVIARYLQSSDGGEDLVFTDSARISVSAPRGLDNDHDFDLLLR